ncbi:hypothetical protein SLE2022_363050 [Rubroshorea leprosula]
MNQLMLHLHNSPSMNLNTTTEKDVVQWYIWLHFIAHLVAYTAVLVLILIAILMILKYVLEIDIDDNNEDERRPTETSPLRSTHNVAAALAHRTCEDHDHQDLESGNCESDDELYERKLCVICYDKQRNCFFVPCGHCATCCECAERIFNGENKNCPVCRRLIGKVGRLPAP